MRSPRSGQPGSRRIGRRSNGREARALVEQLKRRADPAQAQRTRRSLNTQLPLLGCAATQVKEVAGEFLKAQGRALGPQRLYSIVQDLWKTGYLEARVLGLLILKRFEKQFDDRTWRLADRWLNEIDDWSLCDTLCVCLTAPMVANDLSRVEKLIPWTEAESPWRRRAALVSLRRLNRRGASHPEETFRVCQRLMQDTEWPVRKALGFILRDVAASAPGPLAEFLKHWKAKTHRGVIREASKKLPPDLRQAVLTS